MARPKLLTVSLTLACVAVVSASMYGSASARTTTGSSDSTLTAKEREEFVEGARKVAGLGDEEIERVLRNPEMIDDIPVSQGPVTTSTRKVNPARSDARAGTTNRGKVMTIPLEDANGDLVLKLVMTKVWTSEGNRTTYGNMTAEPWVRQDARYTPGEGGWRYAEWAEYGTEEFVGSDGYARGGHRSTRAGLFEFSRPNAPEPSGWSLMGGVLTGRYDGDFYSASYAPKRPRFTLKPRPLTPERTASFEFSLEPGADFECARDGADPSPCSSPKTYSSLAEGQHRFRLHAIDADGRAALKPFPYEWTVDYTPPRVVSIEPAAGMTGVAAGASVEAVFSEDVEAASLLSSVVLRRSGAEDRVEGFLGYNSSSRRAVLTPDAPLVRGASYTAEIRGGERGVKDGAGNALQQDKVWNFTVTP